MIILVEYDIFIEIYPRCLVLLHSKFTSNTVTCQAVVEQDNGKPIRLSTSKVFTWKKLQD